MALPDEHALRSSLQRASFRIQLELSAWPLAALEIVTTLIWISMIASQLMTDSIRRLFKLMAPQGSLASCLPRLPSLAWPHWDALVRPGMRRTHSGSSSAATRGCGTGGGGQAAGHRADRRRGPGEGCHALCGSGGMGAERAAVEKFNYVRSRLIAMGLGVLGPWDSPTMIIKTRTHSNMLRFVRLCQLYGVGPVVAGCPAVTMDGSARARGGGSGGATGGGVGAAAAAGGVGAGGSSSRMSRFGSGRVYRCDGEGGCSVTDDVGIGGGMCCGVAPPPAAGRGRVSLRRVALLLPRVRFDVSPHLDERDLHWMLQQISEVADVCGIKATSTAGLQRHQQQQPLLKAE